jgi:hypothetical protein
MALLFAERKWEMEKLIKNDEEQYQLIYDAENIRSEEAENIRIEEGENVRPKRINPDREAFYQALSINKNTGRISTLSASVFGDGEWQVNKYCLDPVSFGRYVPGKGFDNDRAWKKYSRKPEIELGIAARYGLEFEESNDSIKFR